MKRILLAVIFLISLYVYKADSTTFTVHAGYMGMRVFFPNAISNVHVGDTITWVWDSGMNHTTTSTTVPTGAATWDHAIDNGISFTYIVTVAGNYNYVCTTHATLGMTGSFNVLATGIEKIGTVADVYRLFQNYPNPFNPVTTINFSIPQNNFVTLKVYDITGREVKTLINSNLPAGEFKYAFDASSISSGIYFYKIVAGDFMDIKRLALIK